MNTWRVYLSFSLKGTQKLFHILSEVDELKLSNAAIVFPPSFLLNGSNTSDTWNCCYTWNKNFQHDTLQEITNTFKHLNKDNSECNNHEDDVEFITDCVHQLANEIPSTGISLLEIYVFLGDEVYNDDLHMDLFLALKRLELWNNALMMLIEEDGNDSSTRSWTDLFNFELITDEMFHNHHTSTALWGGAVTLLMEKRSSHLPIGKWYLHATQESTKDGKDRKDEFFKNILGRRLTNGMAFGNNIEIVACVQQEDLPYHLMYPVKYTLHSLNEKTGFDFFKFCSKIKGCWCMAFLRYDFSKQTITPERTREEWMQHIQESLSHYLCIDYSWSRLRNHCVMFVRYSELNNQDKTSTESSCILDVYFLRHRSFFNANGYLELLKKCDDGLENSLADEKLEASNQYTSQAVELIHPSEWCEKQAWYLRENASNVGKSIARFKSDEFFMGGVPITTADAAKSESAQIFPQFIKMFEKDGRTSVRNLQPVPIIMDRMFKNLKAEEKIKKLEYTEAREEIGHGIDYCLDSISAVRLDGRLTKVQKRYVPEETNNLAVFIEEPESETGSTGPQPVESSSSQQQRVVPGIKRSLSKTEMMKNSEEKPSAASKRKSSQPVKKETRKEKTMRRLRTLVDGVVLKYGGLEPSDVKYKECCQKLFDICVDELKKLTSSKNLNEQMRQLAKNNLHKVIVSNT